jgi:hypothetical protein
VARILKTAKDKGDSFERKKMATELTRNFQIEALPIRGIALKISCKFNGLQQTFPLAL